MAPRPDPAPAPVPPPVSSTPTAGPEPIDLRPYELRWNPRHEAYDPLVDFDFLLGWTTAPSPGLEASFERSLERPLWGRYAGKLTFRGAATGTVDLLPPDPVEIRDRVDSLQLWVYGPAGIAEADRPRVIAVMDDAAGQQFEVPLGSISWEGWNLLHQRLPALGPSESAAPLRLLAIRWENCRSPDPVTYFIDSMTAYAERRVTLRSPLCPPVHPPDGAGDIPGEWTELQPGHFVLRTQGEAGDWMYEVEAGALGNGIRVWWNGEDRGNFLHGLVTVPGDTIGGPYQVARAEEDGLHIGYTNGIICNLRAQGPTLSLSVEGQGNPFRGLRVGAGSDAEAWNRIDLPGLCTEDTLPVEIGWSDGSTSNHPPLFACTRFDWNRSAASGFHGLEARYLPNSDGDMVRLAETIHLTVAPRLQQVWPTSGPVGPRRDALIDRVWVDSDGPVAYAPSLAETGRRVGLGIRSVVQGHLASCWRDEQESCSLRDRAAPGKGGDEALRAFLGLQHKQGWMTGLWVNYLQVHPLNEYWTEPILQRTRDLNWRAGLPGHVRVKPVAAAEIQASLAPRIQKRFAPAMAYIGEMAAAPPWFHTDFDAGTAGAGRFDTAFHCIAHMLRTEGEVGSGPVVGDGGAESLYAGHYDGYLVRDRQFPTAFLPGYVLQSLQKRAVRIGAGDQLLALAPETLTAAALDAHLDRYLAHQIAFGAIGRLAPSGFGPIRECRSYYMMKDVQSLCLAQAVERISYSDGSTYVSPSQAIASGVIDDARLYVRYGRETELWVNGGQEQEWAVRIGADTWTLPPAGWVVSGPGFFELSADVEGRRIDYLSVGLNRYLDGRGQIVRFRGLAASGPLSLRVVLREGGFQLVFTDLAHTGRFGFVLPQIEVQESLNFVEYDADGTRVGQGAAPLRDGMFWVEGRADRYVIDVTGDLSF